MKKNEVAQQVELVQSIKVDINLVDNNDGQIDGVKRNPREMTEMEFKKLKKSLSRNPDFTAISELKLYKVGERYITIGGNMRLRAMKDLGWQHVIGKLIPEGTPVERLNEYILLDNANFGKWDFDALANEWSAELLADMNIEVPEQAEPSEDEIAEDDNADIEQLKPAEAKSKVGDIYILGEHRLIVGDSTKREYIDALMQGQLADLLITDPPYNVSYEGKTAERKKIANDQMEDSTFQEFLFSAFSVADEHLKPGGAFYIWHAGVNGYNFKIALKKTGWQLRQILIWNKNAFALGRQDYQWKHEPCLYGWKDGSPRYFVNNRSLTTVIEKLPEIDSMTKAELKQLVIDILQGEIPSTVINENKPLRNADHPTMKPVPLIGKLIINSSRRGEIVLDMFGGSGTTLIAAEQLGRRCRMVEFDPIYADVIIKRWENLTGEKAQYVGNIHEKQ